MVETTVMKELSCETGILQGFLRSDLKLGKAFSLDLEPT